MVLAEAASCFFSLMRSGLVGASFPFAVNSFAALMLPTVPLWWGCISVVAQLALQLAPEPVERLRDRVDVAGGVVLEGEGDDHASRLFGRVNFGQLNTGARDAIGLVAYLLDWHTLEKVFVGAVRGRGSAIGRPCEYLELSKRTSVVADRDGVDLCRHGRNLQRADAQRANWRRRLTVPAGPATKAATIKPGNTERSVLGWRCAGHLPPKLGVVQEMRTSGAVFHPTSVKKPTDDNGLRPGGRADLEGDRLVALGSRLLVGLLTLAGLRLAWLVLARIRVLLILLTWLRLVGLLLIGVLLLVCHRRLRWLKHDCLGSTVPLLLGHSVGRQAP